MQRLLVLCAVLLTALLPAAAQSKRELAEMRRDAIREAKLDARTAASGTAGVTASGVTAADVGEPDSFGKNAVFLGIAGGGVIFVDTDCNSITLGPDDRCLQVNDLTAITSATFTDIGRITIPGKSVSNIIYTLNNHTVSYHMANPSAGNVFGRFTYSPTITIESDALNDPAAIDPNTNLPMNGSYTTTGNGTRSLNRSLFPGAAESATESYTRANTLGFSRTFFAGLGLPQSVINQLYKKPMTIRLGAIVTVRNVDSALMTYTTRFLGN